MVWILAQDDNFDGVERRVSRPVDVSSPIAMMYRCRKTGDLPAVHVVAGRKDSLTALSFFLQESLQIQKLLGDNLVFEMGQPTLMQGVDF
jgi:hypothetical protein